jgi:surface antigen
MDFSVRDRVSHFRTANIGRRDAFVPAGNSVLAGLSRFAMLGLVFGLPFGLGGCATAIPLPSFISKQDITGSIHPISPLSSSLDAEDWRRAKGAMGVALDPQGNGMPVTWDNPKSGAKGVFRPVGEAKPVDDKICRSFVAELAGSVPDQSVQGTACRDKSGDWALGEVSPWKKA